jgi:DNA topoisomerase-1
VSTINFINNKISYTIGEIGMRVIVTEKEEVARRVAETLIPEFQVRSINDISFFEGDNMFILPARGHLVNYTIKNLRAIKSLSSLPLTDITQVVNKYSKNRFELIQKYLKEADDFIIATDWDREGEVIGYNLVKYGIGIEDPTKIPRAYYSSLRSADVRQAFQSGTHMNEALLTQGLARNYADLVIGLNLTKAMTLIFRQTNPGLGQAISLGRVQSPLLSYIGEGVGFSEWGDDQVRYDSYYTTQYFINLGDVQYELSLESEPVDNRIRVVGTKEVEGEEQQAESLYNTASVMKEARLNPTETMEILEGLYLKGYLTYPRTTSRYVRNPEFLREIEEKIRDYKELPDSFSWENTPAEEVEEAHPDAVVLTPEGVEALLMDKLKGREKFLASLILNSIIRSFAPALEFTETQLRARYSNVDGEREVLFSWGKEYENMGDAIEGVESHSRVVPDPGMYNIIKIKSDERKESANGVFHKSVITLSDLDLVNWMGRVGIGTEATRQIFPGVLRDRNYTGESNFPTSLGEVVSKIIQYDMELSSQLTEDMERAISATKALKILPQFVDMVSGVTKDLIDKLGNTTPPVFVCPRGHQSSLVNRMNKGTRRPVLLLRCEECNKYYTL